MTPPKRPRRPPSRAAQQRAYQREVAAWQAEDRAHWWRLVGYAFTGLAIWWMLERDPGGSRWMPKIMGLAVAVAVGNMVEILRRDDG